MTLQLQPWISQPGPQREAIRKHWVEELLFGGARGGGKSDFLLGDFGQDVPRVGDAWKGILFRKTYNELEELIFRSRKIYPLWFPDCKYNQTEKTWSFPNGASLKMRYLESDIDAERYQGHQYSWIGWDELGNWATPRAYNMLKACLRSADGVPNKRIRATANPGGAGHLWIKKYFGIDRYPLGSQVFRDPITSMRRVFIKSRLSDNRILVKNDPNYANMLRGTGSEALVKAWLDGDWDIIAGAFFDCWSPFKHIVKPFNIPPHWTRFMSFDWGSAAPFSVGWWAVASESNDHVSRGALVRYREWYGANEKGEGLKLDAEDVARGIREREIETPGAKIAYRVADPAIFKVDGGPSIAERMSREGVIFRPADNSRVNGWDQMRARMKGDAEGGPMIVCFDRCVDSIRTIPALQHDQNRLEDVDTEQEDHAADEWRYACMSRPYVKASPKKPGDITRPLTYDDYINAQQSRPAKSNRI